MSARLKLGAQALAVGLVALLLALLVWKLAKGSGKEAAVGKAAPNFTLSRIGEPGSLQLASLRGKVVVLNLDVNDFAGDARKFARRYGLDYPLVHDNHNVTSPKYGLTGLPETFFLDRTGKLVEHVPGEVKLADIQDGVERALSS